MSKAAKQSIFILIFLIVASLGYAGYNQFVEIPRIEGEKAAVEEELEQTQIRESKNLQQIKKLNGQIDKLSSEKSGLEGRLRSAEGQITSLQTEVGEITDDRDTWKRRVDKVTQERDELTRKVNKAQKEFSSYKQTAKQELEKLEEELTKAVEAAPPKQSNSTSNMNQSVSSSGNTSRENEDYWASLLKEKASLEIKVEQLHTNLSEKSIEIVEIRQKNSNMQIELDRFKHESAKLAEEIRYKGDLINNLSLELARTKNDKKFTSERIGKLNEENTELRQNLKQLVSAKGSLEKSIVRLTQDKNKVEKELGKSESLIQSKIDEIWEIKDSLDRTFQESAKASSSSKEVELPPIVVSSGGHSTNFNTGASEPGFFGKVVSLNKENNFVILDIGESSGIQLGDMVSVYRDSKYIARLEIIQVRKDICAADVKDQWSQIRVGDIVR